MADSVIRIVNARQHNLQGVTVDLPHRALTVVTGPSGSGKSTLAFDTLYAEGQRRYIESLSTYAKQFLDRMPKPLVDRLEGIAPSVAIEQRNPMVSSRSTVGTATEVYDYLRLLWARIGRSFCRACGAPVRRDTPQSAADEIVAAGAARVQIAFPLPPVARLAHAAVVENLRALGFVRVDRRRRRRTTSTSCPPSLDLTRAGELLVVVDRLGGPAAALGRLSEAVAVAFQEGEGIALALHDGGRLRFTRWPACSACDTPAATVTPALFSFNNPRGACAACNGFGAVLEYDESLVVPDPGRSLAEGAIDPWTKPRYETRRKMLLERAQSLGADPTKPWHKLKAAHRRELLYGRKGRYVGIFPFLKDLEEKRYKQYIRVFLRQYQLAKTCGECGGARLNPDALAVRIGRETIADVAGRPIDAIHEWLGGARAHAVRARGGAPRAGPARRAARLPARRRPRLSHARPADPHALRRRGPADLPLQRARLPAGGHALRARRAVGRACTRATPTACWRCSAGCATAATPSSWSSTISPRSSRPTSCSSSGPGSGDHGGRVVHAGPVVRRDAIAHRAVPHRAEADRRAERAAAGRPALAQGPRRAAAQPARRGRGHPARARSPR